MNSQAKAATSRFTYEQVANELRRDITEGRLAVGDRMPSIRSLADRFDISPNTAGNALKLLREQGFAYSGSTTGYFVADHQASGLTDAEGAGVESKLAMVLEELAKLSERVSVLEGRSSQSSDPHATKNQ